MINNITKNKAPTEKEKNMWSEGTIGINAFSDEPTVIFHYWVKHYEEGSEFGIDGGRISKLRMTVKGETVVNYDRGWDIEPETKEAKQAYAILLAQYN